ncbi:MAG: hypothetical protein AAF645_09530 [Myxococcota bacterium]
MPSHRLTLFLFVLALGGCESGDSSTDAATDGSESAALYSVGTIVTQPTGRTLFVQTVPSLEGSLNLDSAIEAPGNSRHWAYEGSVYVGLGQEPTLIRYVPDEEGRLQEVDRLSFSRFGVGRMPPALTFLSPTKAYLLLYEELTLAVFDPTAMEITGEVDLSSLGEEGFTSELWFPTLSEGRLYVPVRPVNYATFDIVPSVRVAIFDTERNTLLGVADDRRCVAASRPAVGPDGDVYVIGEGRNYITQVLAEARDAEAPPTCLLRIRAGETRFDPDYFVDVASFTEGLGAATGMWQVPGEPGVAYAKMVDLSALPEDASLTALNLFGFSIFRFWRIELGDEVRAVEVGDQPASTIDFGASSVDGLLYFGVGDTSMGGETNVLRIEPSANRSATAFSLTGSLRDIYRLR